MKRDRIAGLLEPFHGRDLSAQYLGFFECFNQGRFFEAHEVLESLWLNQRGQPLGLFYKGLIQMAGAFVHWHRQRPQPAVSLFNLARSNLAPYAPLCERLPLDRLLLCLDQWSAAVQSGISFASSPRPKLELNPPPLTGYPQRE